MTVLSYSWEASTEEVARTAGIPPERVVRFDTNTAPFAPPWATEALSAAHGDLNEYPSPDYRELTEAAAAYAGVPGDRVVVGAGADELLDLAAKAFLPPGGTAVAPVPTYSMYAVLTAQRPARLVEVARLPGHFSVPTEPLVRSAERSDLVWLCRPNNPTGASDPDEVIRAVLEAARGVVVLDAAYAELGGDRWAPWVERHPNLVVLHTLSKAFGLAAVRVGYALCPPALAEQLNARRPPGSISSLSAALAARALGDGAWLRTSVEAILAERERLAAGLRELGLTPLPSRANFLLVEAGPRAGALADELLRRGLVVRTYASDGLLAGHLRITVRSPEDDDRLLETLKEVLA